MRLDNDDQGLVMVTLVNIVTMKTITSCFAAASPLLMVFAANGNVGLNNYLDWLTPSPESLSRA
jgi:hypothetical protein